MRMEAGVDDMAAAGTDTAVDTFLGRNFARCCAHCMEESGG